MWCGSVSKPCTPLVNIKIAGKWMFIPLKMVLIGIDPYPCRIHPIDGNSNIYRWLICPSYLHGIRGFPSNVWWFPAKSHQNIPKKKSPNNHRPKSSKKMTFKNLHKSQKKHQQTPNKHQKSPTKTHHSPGSLTWSDCSPAPQGWCREGTWTMGV